MQTGSLSAEFDDPEAFAALIHNGDVRVLPDRPGAFRGRLTLVRLTGFHFAMGEENQARLYRGRMDADRVYFRLKQPDEPPGLFDGQSDAAGTVRVKQDDRTYVERITGAGVLRAMSLPRADLTARAEVLLGRSLPGLLADADLLRPTDGNFQRLAALQRYVLRLAQRAPMVLSQPATATVLDNLLGEALLAMLDGASGTPDSSAVRRGHRIMRRVDDLVEANPARPLSLAELCAAAGCSIRTLEMLFRERYGQTPNRYLRGRRLWQARQALRAADPATATVTGIALASGFPELGRFAVAYREMFGESPSATLRREPDANS